MFHIHDYALLLLMNASQEVLLIKRINVDYGNNEYSLVGRKIRAHETAREAVVHKAQDELGITLDVNDLSFAHLLHRKGTETEFFAMVFKATNWQGTPENLNPDKRSEIEWFSLDNLPENILPGHKQILECIKNGELYSEHGW